MIHSRVGGLSCEKNESRGRSQTISHRITQNVRQPYDVRTITSLRCSYDYLITYARLPQDGHANLQDCRKTMRYVVQFPHSSRAAIVRFSAVVVRFATFLRQACNKAHGYLVVVLRRGWRTITYVVRTPCVPCSSLVAALRVL